MNTIEIDAAEALQDTKLRVHIPAPWFLKMFGKKKITLCYYRPVIAQLIRMSRLFAMMNVDITEAKKLDEIDSLKLIADNAKLASRCIAVGLIRSKIKVILFHRIMAAYIRRHMDVKQLSDLTKLVLVYSGAENFMNIIRLIAHLDVMTPNLSQEKKTGS